MSSGSGHDDLSATEPSTRRERAGTERGRVARGKRKFSVPAVVKAMSAAGCVVICAEHDPHTGRTVVTGKRQDQPDDVNHLDRELIEFEARNGQG
jgi:hypothetical protein